MFLLYSHTVITLILLTPDVWVFPHTKQMSATPVGHPTILFSSDTFYLDLASDPTG